ncbi:MAG: hypothetical protein KatS3mg029_0363 [Saprospiraceae bacterium]|nr:MAG: hypothetical protein KatS3mg029_0363 [Saprospiraceae bacterium]
MPHRPHLFEEFPPVSKAEWIAQIERDLKGKAIEDLDWSVGSLRFSPFHHLDDRTGAPSALVVPAWEAAEDIPAADLLEANKLAHKAVGEGMESLRFLLSEPLGDHRMEGLIDGIDPLAVSLHFFEKNRNAEPLNLLRHLYHVLEKQHLDATKVRGCLAWTTQAPVVEKDAMSLLGYVHDHLPGYKVLPVGVGLDWSNPQRTVENLAALLTGMDGWLASLTEAGFEPDTIHRHLFVLVGVSDNYFVGLATVRAVRMLGDHLARAWGIESEHLFIDAYFSPFGQSEDPYRQLLAATTRAMAAIAGGANRLTITPPDAIDPEHPMTEEESRHLVRNIHHILRLESFFDAVSDPAAGSYFFEHLTERLAAAAWQHFVDASREQ